MARRLPSNSKSSNSRNLTDFQNLIPSHELFLKDEFIEKSDSDLQSMLKDVMTDIDPDRIQLTQEDERDPEFLKQLAQLDPDAVENNKEVQKEESEVPKHENSVQTLTKDNNQTQQITKNKQDHSKVTNAEPMEVTPPTRIEDMPDTHMDDASTPSNKSSTQSSTTQPSNSGTLRIIRDRIEAYNKYALKYQRSGDQTTAAKYLNVIKGLRSLEEKVIKGEKIDPQQVPPPPALLAHPSPKKASASSSQSKQHPLPKSSLTSTKMTITSKQKTPPKSTLKQQLVPSTINAEHATPSEENIDLSQLPPDSEIFEDESEAEENVSQSREKTFEIIETYLKRQIITAHNNALKAKQVGKREEAIQFLREKKKMMKDLAQVTEAKKHPNVPPPEYRIQVMKKQEVVTNPDLAMEHMEFNIIRCIDVRPPRGYTSLALYVYSVLPFPSNSSIKLRTPTVKDSISPEYNYKMKVWIDRKPSFLRFVKNKKIIFEIYHQRGFFWRDLLIGRAEWKPEALLNQCTVHAVVDIVEGRKNIVGKLEFQVRLRQPLATQQIRVTEQKYLIITKHFPLTNETSSNTITTTSPLQATKNIENTTSNPNTNTESQSTKHTTNTNNNNNNNTNKVLSTVPTEQKNQQINTLEISLTASEMYNQLPVKENTSLPTTTQNPVMQSTNASLSSSTLPSALPSSTKGPLITTSLDLSTDLTVSVPLPVKPPPPQTKTKQPLSASKRPPQPTKPTQQSASLEQETDNDIVMDSIDRIKSNAVLEYEQQKIEKEIENLKRAKKKIPEELTDRLAQVKLKLNLLALQIETGQLTIESYAQMLKNEINFEKSLAEKLKKQGKIELAKEALHRAKLMEEELLN